MLLLKMIYPSDQESVTDFTVIMLGKLKINKS